MNSKLSPYLWPVFFALAVVGVADAGYLTVEHYRGLVPGCAIGRCEEVLTSVYATVFGVPISLGGLALYVTLIVLGALYLFVRRAVILPALVAFTGAAFFGSLVLMHIQLSVLEAVCVFCTISAGISTALFALTLMIYTTERSRSAAIDSER